MYGFEYLKKFLQEEGYKIREEEDGHFSFKYQGTVYIAFKNESPYLQVIVICNTENVGTDELLRACNEVNKERYVVKCMAMDKSAWVSYECRPNESTTSEDFEGILGQLDNDSDLLFKKLSNK